MLTLFGGSAGVPVGRGVAAEAKELTDDLPRLDVLLSDHELLWPIVERWREEFRARAGWC